MTTTVEHASFNGQCDHRVTVEDGKTMQTVSIVYAGKRRLTLCFIPFEEGGTVDIQRHDDDIAATRDDNGEDTQWWPLISFCSEKDEEGRVKMGRYDIHGSCALLSLPYGT